MKNKEHPLLKFFSAPSWLPKEMQQAAQMFQAVARGMQRLSREELEKSEVGLQTLIAHYGSEYYRGIREARSAVVELTAAKHFLLNCRVDVSHYDLLDSLFPMLLQAHDCALRAVREKEDL